MHSGAIVFQVHDGAAVWGKHLSDLQRRGNRSGTAGGGGGGVGLDQLVIPLVEIDENHAVPDGTADGLWSSTGPAKAPIRADVLVLLARHDYRLSEEGDHQRVATVGDCRDEVDEMPPRSVGRSHFTPEDPVVRWNGHASVRAGATPQEGSPGVPAASAGATPQEGSPGVRTASAATTPQEGSPGVAATASAGAKPHEGSPGAAVTAPAGELPQEGSPEATAPSAAAAMARAQRARSVLDMGDLHLF